MNGFDIRGDDMNILPGDDAPSGEVRAVHMENILLDEQGMELRTKYKGVDLVRNGKERRFGYDYKGASNIPWNYGSDKGYKPNPLLKQKSNTILNIQLPMPALQQLKPKR